MELETKAALGLLTRIDTILVTLRPVCLTAPSLSLSLSLSNTQTHTRTRVYINIILVSQNYDFLNS